MTTQKKPLPTLSLLKAFYEVGRCRSFKQAADNLELSQPTVIKQVGELEQMYSAKLFTRGRGNNRLTDLGVQMMPLCRSVINGVREIDEFMQSHGKLIHGTLTIAAVSPYYVTQALKIFVSKYPKIKIKVVYGSNKKVLELLQIGEVDIGLFVHNDVIPGFRSFLCKEDQIIAIIPASNRLSEKDGLDVEDIKGEILLSREKGSITQDIFDHEISERSIEPAARIEIGSREAIREGVIQGLGIGVVTEHEHNPDDKIVATKFKNIDLSMKYSFVVSNERLGSRLIRAFLQCAEKDLKQPLHQ
ncbi:LysR substrate-binding domain-containing protein [Vibrio comitans]|uniref:Transcriptional regulator n=1 Tax=Vibrio comitans NBRC 102076 TaxID=1219078 RepID=A0A4Y3IIF1_9VIBR|nr:LysR substrate-binding domain-containing protein [Vibrio comitans]GEA59126.1 transcriptional regulator [Vibrio comitans NBRC 102076]